jgi:hypothetical protein
MDRTYSPTEVARLAALCRTYHEALPDILAAVVQEVRRDLDPDWRSDVAKRFGLTEQEIIKLDQVKALYYGYVQRAGLKDPEEVYALVMRDIETGRLKPGDQLPPRTKFVEQYHCDKRTHGEVTTRLDREGYIQRPGGVGGPLYIR